MNNLPHTQETFTLTGLAGTGKSITGTTLQTNLNLEHKMSAGDFVRDMIDSNSWGVTSFDLFEELAQHDMKYDSEIDLRTTHFGEAHTSFVFDGRMAWSCIPHSVKVLLTCDDDVRFQRVADHRKMSLEEARKQTLMREESIRARFKKWYSVDRFDDPRHFDLSIDTTRRPVEDVVAEIIEFTCRKRKLVFVA